MSEEQNHAYKVVLCKYYNLEGFCQKGSNCTFAHGEEELRTPVGWSLYKTVLCKKFIKNQCKHGDLCRFAHSDEELRPPVSDVPEMYDKQKMKLDHDLELMVEDAKYRIQWAYYEQKKRNLDKVGASVRHRRDYLEQMTQQFSQMRDDQRPESTAVEWFPFKLQGTT